MNHRTFFMLEPAQVSARASTNLTIMQITFKELMQFAQDSPKYERQLLSHQMKILNMGKNYPMDYIRQVHEDFMTEVEAEILPEVAERSSHMKLMGKVSIL